MFYGLFKRSGRVLAALLVSVMLGGIFAGNTVSVSAGEGDAATGEPKSLIGTVFTDSRLTFEITYDATDKEAGSVKLIGNNLKKKTKSLFLPSYITYQGKEYSVISIGEYAFANSHITALYINSRVYYIEKYAFAMSALEVAALPNSVYEIGEGAFALCSSLRSVEIGSNVYDLAHNAFAYCDSLEDIRIDENNVEYVCENGIIYNKAKTKLICAPAAKGETVIPDTVSSIVEYAFEGNKQITSVILNNKIKTIPAGAFYGCENLRSVTVPSNITKIQGNPFQYCISLDTFDIDGGNKKYKAENGMLLSISGKTLYAYPSAKGAIVLPSTVKIIEAYALSGALNLEAVRIPANIKKIRTGAFYDCENLENVYFEKRTNVFTDAAASAEEKVFGNTAPFIAINLPYSKKAFTEGSIENALKENCPSTVIFINR